MRLSDVTLRTFSARPFLLGMVLLAECLLLVGCNGGGMGTEDSRNSTFDSGNIAPGETFSFTFQEEGTEYYCTIHGDDMEGKVTVDSEAEMSETVDVSMENTSFTPKRITVPPGTKVVWTNNDSFDHTVTSGDPSTGDGGY